MKLLFSCLPRLASKQHRKPSPGPTAYAGLGSRPASPQPAVAGQHFPAGSRCADTPRGALQLTDDVDQPDPPAVRVTGQPGASRSSSSSRQDGHPSSTAPPTRSSWAAALAAAPCSVEHVDEFFRQVPGRAVIVMSLQPAACAPSCKVLGSISTGQ